MVGRPCPSMRIRAQIACDGPIGMVMLCSTTVMLIVIVEWMRQWTWYEPAVSNVCLNVSPWTMQPLGTGCCGKPAGARHWELDSNCSASPVPEVTVWPVGGPSLSVQTSWSPMWMVMLAGLNALPCMLTLKVMASWCSIGMVGVPEDDGEDELLGLLPEQPARATTRVIASARGIRMLGHQGGPVKGFGVVVSHAGAGQMPKVESAGAGLPAVVDVLRAALKAVGLFESDAVEERPWGLWVDWYRSDDAVLKCMVIRPGARMSLQRHKERAEVWRVISGRGEDQGPNPPLALIPGTTRVVHQGDVHRIANTGPDPLVIVELQLGHCDEHDIERLADDYKRN
jgi:mannose-6-phosphate isomerase